MLDAFLLLIIDLLSQFLKLDLQELANLMQAFAQPFDMIMESLKPGFPLSQ
jgi:hypothetical protein